MFSGRLNDTTEALWRLVVFFIALLALGRIHSLCETQEPPPSTWWRVENGMNYPLKTLQKFQKRKIPATGEKRKQNMLMCRPAKL